MSELEILEEVEVADDDLSVTGAVVDGKSLHLWPLRQLPSRCGQIC
jgi:hypothetical protein